MEEIIDDFSTEDFIDWDDGKYRYIYVSRLN